VKRVRARLNAYQPSGVEGFLLFILIGLAGFVGIALAVGAR
jgi:hypothetical protein